MKPASLRWIVDRNPFYLLSACCGLAGCWLLGDISRPDLADVAIKISTVLAYEIAVVVLAVWLAKRIGTHRDAAILSVLALVLTADISFFYTQAAMLPVLPASLFCAFGAAQALLIAGVLLRGIRAGLSRSAEWLVAMDLVAVHVFPLALRLSAQDQEGLELAFWAAFVAVGLLIAAHALPAQWRSESTPPVEGLPLALGNVAPVLALASLVAHVAASEWIYDARVFPVFGSPILLGLAALCLRRETATCSCALSAAAAVLAFAPPPAGSIWNANGWTAGTQSSPINTRRRRGDVLEAMANEAWVSVDDAGFERFCSRNAWAHAGSDAPARRHRMARRPLSGLRCNSEFENRLGNSTFHHGVPSARPGRLDYMAPPDLKPSAIR